MLTSPLTSLLTSLPVFQEETLAVSVTLPVSIAFCIVQKRSGLRKQARQAMPWRVAGLSEAGVSQGSELVCWEGGESTSLL